MALLAFEHVGKRYGRGSQERTALQDVSLQIDAGEMVTVWGRRRSGRSTLLRVAAGLERPDEGVVSFEGRDLAAARSQAWQAGVRFCRKTFRPAEGQTVLEQLMTGQLTRGVARAEAKSRARAALRRVDAEPAAPLKPSEMDGEEAIRVALARAIVHPPQLLVVDEPALGLDVHVRDQILALLRSISRDGISVLSSATDTSGLAGADRALSLADGMLSGELHPPELAQVVPIRGTAGTR